MGILVGLPAQAVGIIHGLYVVKEQIFYLTTISYALAIVSPAVITWRYVLVGALRDILSKVCLPSLFETLKIDYWLF